MNFKFYFLTVITLGASSLAFAQSSYQYDIPQTKGSISQVAPASQNAVTFSAESDFNYSSFTNSGTAGSDSHMGVWTPRLMTTLPGDVALHLSAPLVWNTDNQGNNTRYIGRPELGGWFKYSQNMFKLEYGLNLRFPVADSSTGGAEYLRIWGIYPGYNAKLNLANSNFHIVQNGTVSYNSSSQSTYSDSQNDFTGADQFQSPMVLFLEAGAGVDLSSTASVDMTINFANGLGQGRDNSTFTSSGQSQTQASDVPGADLSYLKLSSAIEIAKGTKLTSYISKSLKDASNHATAGLQLDDAPNFATIGAGVGFSQSF